MYIKTDNVEDISFEEETEEPIFYDTSLEKNSFIDDLELLIKEIYGE